MCVCSDCVNWWQFLTHAIINLGSFGWVLWHINHCRSYSAKSSLYINTLYVWFINHLLITFLKSLKFFYVFIYLFIYLLLTIKWFLAFPSNTSNTIFLLIICLHTVKRLQVLLFNTNYSVKHYSFICTQSNGYKYCYVWFLCLMAYQPLQVI